MYIILVSLVIGLFAAMLFLNVYFRVKVMKSYRYMVKHQIDLKARHIFNPSQLEAEVIPTYPESAEQIRTFTTYLRRSISMATVLMILITLFGAILMYYR